MADSIDKAKHKAEELTGTAKEKVGEVADDDDLQAEGAGDRASGNTKQLGDTFSDKVDDVRKKLTD